MIINKKMAATISILLMCSIIVITFPNGVQAQALTLQKNGSISLPNGVTPDLSLETIPYISFRPNPVGVNQGILVNIWLQPPINIARYLTGLTVTITKPDGTSDNIGPMETYYGDGTAWFEYTVDQAGTWKLQFDFPGAYYPAGIYFNPKAGTNTTFPKSVYYKPSTTGQRELTVQQDQVMSWPPAPLPTDYWTRPIPIENREWWTIGGHYPFTGRGNAANWPANTNLYSSNYKFTPYVQAPNTAHVIWKRQGALGGIMGGQFGQRSYGAGEGTYAGTPSIIFQGRAYQSVAKVVNGESTNVWQCYDLRTGEIYWERTGITTVPTLVTYNRLGPSVPGAGETGMGAGGSWGFTHLTYIGGGRLVKFDPWSGAVVRNVSIAPLTTGTLYMEPYVLSVQTINATAGQYRLINWSITDFTQTGALVNLTNRITNNITWPFSSLGTVDFEAGVAVSTYSIMHDATGVAIDVGIMAASLTTGQLLWNISSGVGFGLFSGSTAVADQGKFSVRFNDGYWYCWNLQDGKKLWKSEAELWPWSAFGAYNIASAYGLIYDLSYAGIYAIDWNTGKIAWRYDSGYPGYEAAFSSYPFFTNPVIADGKLYVANGEHSPTEPLMRGWNLHCINATTGEGLWNITGGGTVGAVSDGYITFDSRYDGYMYVFGKGKSATTVSAPQTAIAQGQSIVLTGTVLDQSPGQPNTPCVSAASMGPWMGYLHMQAPIPTNVIGVPVSLDTVDPNGNQIHIATVTSDMSGTFAYTWKPDVSGQYTVTATFVGDESYGSSWAQTYVGVTQAPASTPTPTTATKETPTELYFAGSTIAIIIAIAVATVLILRKKP